MPRDRRDELVSLERVERDVGHGGDRRRPRHVLQESDLAEPLAGPELLAADLHLAHADHVEAIARLTLPDHDGTGRLHDLDQ